MKATGIVRNVDDLGRIVVPKEIRRVMGIGERDPLEIFVDGERIVLQKYAPGCTLCGNTKGLEQLTIAKGKLICNECVESIVAVAKTVRTTR